MDHTYVHSETKCVGFSTNTLQTQDNMKKVPNKRKNPRRSPSPLTDLPLEVQLETEDENGKLVPMVQVRRDILEEQCSNTCELCGRSFPNITGLRTHERSHNGPVNNQPKTSGVITGMDSDSTPELKSSSSFHQSEILSDILRNTETVEEDPLAFAGPAPVEYKSIGRKTYWFQCGQCPFLCATADNLRLHQKIHFPPIIISDSTASECDTRYWKDGMFYVCTYCGKSFLHIVGLRSHSRTHKRDVRD